MNSSALHIVGIGVYLPPGRLVADLVSQAGGNPKAWRGWESVCVAQEGDQPSAMGLRAATQALETAKVDAEKLSLVLFTGTARDFPAAWSVSGEIMKGLKTRSDCIGVDLMIGCLGVLTALDFAQGWLSARGGGYAVIVNADHWAMSMNRRDEKCAPSWGNSDGAGALIVHQGDEEKGLARYHGISYFTQPEMNGSYRVKHGGTRYPFPEGSEFPLACEFEDGLSGIKLIQAYLLAYRSIFSGLTATFGAKPEHIICSQLSPENLMSICQVSGLNKDQVCWTGKQFGHVGGTDIVLGIQRLWEEKRLEGGIFAIASTVNTWGGAYLTGARTA